jgi:hypothetical protein
MKWTTFSHAVQVRALERGRWRWWVVRVCSDGVTRDMHLGKFWRWIDAARIAQALWLVSIDRDKPQLKHVFTQLAYNK